MTWLLLVKCRLQVALTDEEWKCQAFLPSIPQLRKEANEGDQGPPFLADLLDEWSGCCPYTVQPQEVTFPGLSCIMREMRTQTAVSAVSYS